MQPYLLFDAGGTLVFPDLHLLSAQAQQVGLQTSLDDIFAAYCHIIFDIDHHAQQHGRLPVPYYPQGVGWAFYERLGLCNKALEEAAQGIHRRDRVKSLWTFTFPWVVQTLRRLSAQGYRMSVVSNSDGRIAQILDEVGLSHHFERIFDSHIVGIEKPRPGIFEAALNELHLQPAEAIYIGDVFYIDVWGRIRLACQLSTLTRWDCTSTGRERVFLPSLTCLIGWHSGPKPTPRDCPPQKYHCE